MRHLFALRVSLFLLLISPIVSAAQSTPDQSIPRVITITGVYRPADGKAPGTVETVTLSIYADQQGGAPLFQETQQVTLDDRGRYSVVLGAAHADGIPPAIFTAGGQWLGTVFERTGEVEGPRARLTSVPYAMRAAEADTLGGRPASDYQLAPSAGSTTTGTKQDSVGAPAAELPGTPNQFAKYVSTTDVGPAAMYESGTGLVGIGTTTPFDSLHVRFTNTNGGATGLAVQNLGNTNTSYSGMLFYDQNGALGQFQGFNNVTHEYRINNIARNGASQFDGSINFMGGSLSRFYVAPNGNIGIGTTSPSALLEVSNAVPGGPANMWMTSFTNNCCGPYYLARRARGTAAAPTAVQNGDGLSGLYGAGYGATAFGLTSTGGITIQATQNWSDTAQGTSLAFITTANNSTTPATRMTLDPAGNLGIGTSFPTANLEISNGLAPGSPAAETLATYNSAPGGSFLLGRKARGTAAAPTAAQNGDGLLSLSGRGYGTTSFGITGGATIGIRATENYTDTAQGASIQFLTAQNGTTALLTRMSINHDGFVGIGTPQPNGMLDIVRNGTTNVYGTSYGTAQGSGFKGRVARGTFLAPTATLFGDELAEFTAAGYGATDFNETAGWAAFAAENWTDTAQGTALAFYSTPIGSNQPQAYLGILPNGNIGIGTPADANQFPTATDKLQVFGDARVGNAGTNGCLKRFDGTGLVGACSSDRRFKKDITPFGPVLDRVAALQPVHYYWRASEFPDKHFGSGQSYGLIAQDVEQALPELVSTDSDGYKAVDYSKLPLLTIQAVKELKAENDALKERVATLERLMTDLLAASRR
jgi:endosialidase-like protein